MVCDYCGTALDTNTITGKGFRMHIPCAFAVYELYERHRPRLRTFIAPDGTEYEGWLSTDMSKVATTLSQNILPRQLTLPEGDTNDQA